MEDFKELLRARDLKATSSRLNLLQSIRQYKSAMPYSAIQKAMEPIDRVTLYRTLDSLTSKGIIHKAYQENSDTYYAMCDSSCSQDHHHHKHIHFKCRTCEKVSCLHTDSKLELSLPGYEIDKIAIHVEGQCGVCLGGEAA